MSQELSDTASLDALLERFVESLAGAAPLELEALARSLPPALRARFRAQALALEYLARLANGEPVRAEDFRARLADEEQRALFAEALADQAAAGHALPGDLPSGTVLDGRYEIVRALGRGGMGSVYAALDRVLLRQVALKVLRLAADAAPAPEWEALLRRESQLLARLKNESIVTIHDVCRGKERTYLVMDLVPGPDLARVLERARAQRKQRGDKLEHGPEVLRAAIGCAADGARAELLGEASHERCVLRILREIVRAVQAAHAAGVVHHDLKPHNIVILPGGQPVLLDFGLASWRAQGEDPGFSGTPEYLAPEQIERELTGNDPRTDVYQLGLVLYELLTFERAFWREHDEDLAPLLARIQSGTRVPLRELAPWVSPELEAILEHALARDPARRYASAHELGLDLERCLARLPPRHVHVPRARAVRLYAGFVGRHPATWLALLGSLAAFFALRPEPWAPPEAVAAFRYHDGEFEVLDDLQPIEVRADCVLGVDLELPQRSWLYAFSVFGQETRPDSQRLRPVSPALIEDYAAPGFRARPCGGLALAAGAQRVVCTSLSRPDPFEGLRLYVCAAPSALFESLQETLLVRERELGAPASWSDFEALGRELGARVRGGNVVALSAGERGRLSALLSAGRSAAGGAEDDVGKDTGVAKFDFLFEVSSSGH